MAPDPATAVSTSWRQGLHLLAEHLPVGIFVTSPDGQPAYVSPRCAQLLGAKMQPDGEWNWWNLIHPDDMPRVSEQWARALGEPGTGFDETFRLTDGDVERWIRSRADLVLHGETPIGAVGSVDDVTDLQELHRQSTERERMLDAVLSSSSDMIVVIDEQLKLSFVSQGSWKVLGRDPAEWVGRDAFELIHPDDIGRAAESALESIEADAGPRPAIAARLLHADGTWRHTQLVGNNMVDNDHVHGLVVTVHDLSAQLEAEATAAAASDRFEQAFARAPIGMALIANDGRLIRSNQALATMLGRTVQDLAGEQLISLAHPEDRQTATERALSILANDDREPLELRFIGTRGHTAWVRVTATVVRDESGNPEHTIAHFEDVTEQKRAHERLERAAAHDPLTGLLNRAGFSRQFADNAGAGTASSGALLLIDLDGFKPVNDAHGHAAGDELLVQVSQRLSESVRSTDLVGRLGGDEFAIYQADVSDAAMVVTLGERVRASLSRPFEIAAGVVRISGSVGVAMLDGEVELTRALAAADAASYAAKRSGGDRIELTWCTELGLAGIER